MTVHYEGGADKVDSFTVTSATLTDFTFNLHVSGSGSMGGGGGGEGGVDPGIVGIVLIIL